MTHDSINWAKALVTRNESIDLLSLEHLYLNQNGNSASSSMLFSDGLEKRSISFSVLYLRVRGRKRSKPWCIVAFADPSWRSLLAIRSPPWSKYSGNKSHIATISATSLRNVEGKSIQDEEKL